MTESHDPYVVLGVPADASVEDVRRAYFLRVKAHPPDRDPAGFRAIRAAYDALRDPARRAQSDLSSLAVPGDLADTVTAADVPTPSASDLARLLRDGLLRALSDLDRASFPEDCRPLPEALAGPALEVAS